MIYLRCIRNLFSKKKTPIFFVQFCKKNSLFCHVILKFRELCVNYFNSRLDPMTFKVDLTICILCVSSCTSWTALAGQRPTTGCYVRGSSYTGCWSRLSRGRKRWYIITSLDGVNTYFCNWNVYFYFGSTVKPVLSGPCVIRSLCYLIYSFSCPFDCFPMCFTMCNSTSCLFRHKMSLPVHVVLDRFHCISINFV